MYPENPEGTQVIVGSMNMGYISDTVRNRAHDLSRPKREPIPLGHSSYMNLIRSEIFCFRKQHDIKMTSIRDDIFRSSSSHDIYTSMTTDDTCLSSGISALTQTTSYASLTSEVNMWSLPPEIVNNTRRLTEVDREIVRLQKWLAFARWLMSRIFVILVIVCVTFCVVISFVFYNNYRNNKSKYNDDDDYLLKIASITSLLFFFINVQMLYAAGAWSDNAPTDSSQRQLNHYF